MAAEPKLKTQPSLLGEERCILLPSVFHPHRCFLRSLSYQLRDPVARGTAYHSGWHSALPANVRGSEVT
ncbi:hypothetical protein FA13DRAFT_1738698 [Coprinellus micaceus]|uniref:Uncharacterized protein n=1 Tax=Coprinellus micaceus TaxID=71717 RepID=A0A4Y7ST84_COPMI|nr:hypothetical protein FA13DRAFT_1738698 [Coprinellus micaceus]